MTNYDLANERITEDIANNKVDETTDNTNANNYAKNIMKTYDQENQQTHHLQPSQQYPSPTSQIPEQSLAQQYQPPVPPQQQLPMPQQSQYQRPQPQQPAAPAASAPAGSYTGFDAADNLAPLDADFTSMKEVVRRPANVHSEARMSDNVEPYSDLDAEQFSSF